MRKIFTSICAALVLTSSITSNATAQAINEGFDNITTLAGSGWVQTNNSVPVGSTSWFQGNPTVFAAFGGATDSYIGANFNNTTGANTISNWLITPNRTIKNGDVISFYTRTTLDNIYPDNLQVRMSLNGASSNVGVGSAAVGDFTTLLLQINPTLVTSVYPYLAWAQYTVTISGMAAPTSGRFAFRYYVPNGGPSGANSDYIGIDNFIYTPYVCPTLTMTAAGALSTGTAGTAYSTTLTQTGCLGAPTFAVVSGALPSGLTLATNGTISGTPSATGTFNFTVGVADASGCATSASYSLQVNCPANPASLNGLPTICSNAGSFVLTQGSPAGGVYTGTGVVAGTFNPTAGTQTITYTYTDSYSCVHVNSNQITVNTAPTVTLGSIANICSNDSPVALTGGSPAGGVYSGTGVSGGNFDPSAGSQSIMYSYTAGNTCSNMAMTSITVNAAPIVTQIPVADACENAGIINLSGGSPVGGIYSGTGVTGSDFDPIAGTQIITYSYTDGNSCSSITTFSINVIPSATALLPTFTAVCDNIAPFTLNGGLPVGGVYSGTGVTGSVFNPSVGTQTITYTIGGGTACESSASEILTVNTTPTVTIGSIANICSNDSPIALTGGSPAGGVYSGTGVSGGNFDPAAGTQSIMYSYTDGNSCSNMASTLITVNAAPIVSLTLNPSTVCVYYSSYSLSGGSPSGGSYNGSGVSGGNFDPSVAGVGNASITYDYTDGNGCNASSNASITIDACASVEELNEAVLTIYPNPTISTFNISSNEIIHSYALELIDLTGKKVATESRLTSTSIIEFTIANSTPGVYFIKGSINEQLVTMSITIE